MIAAAGPSRRSRLRVFLFSCAPGKAAETAMGRRSRCPRRSACSSCLVGECSRVVVRWSRRGTRPLGSGVVHQSGRRGSAGRSATPGRVGEYRSGGRGSGGFPGAGTAVRCGVGDSGRPLALPQAGRRHLGPRRGLALLAVAAGAVNLCLVHAVLFLPGWGRSWLISARTGIRGGNVLSVASGEDDETAPRSWESHRFLPGAAVSPVRLPRGWLLRLPRRENRFPG